MTAAANTQRSGKVPTLTMPVIPDDPHADVYFDAHSHPYSEGTYVTTTREGVVMRAAAGVSSDDAWSNVVLHMQGKNAYSYTVAPEGIYRVYQGKCNWVAPIRYINPGN
jgi:hypothetical protein